MKTQEILMQIFSFLLGSMGTGMVLYITSMIKISKLSAIIESLKNELTIRNDHVLKELSHKQEQIDTLKTITKHHDGEINEINIKLASFSHKN